MRCLNCNSNDWENVDSVRIKPSGMSICKCCGFVSYPSKWKSYEDLKQHYRTSYRNPPTSQNFFSGQRKIYFHNTFLQDVFTEWNEKGFDAPNVFEAGAAYGMVLDWLRGNYPKGSFSGTEWTTSFKRNAKHEYGLELVDDFDTSKKHDLIISYKVAEHQLDVDKELRKYAEHLTDEGYLYISVPTWFDSACNFGLSGFDLEYYYDPNHINVWTKEMFENILERAGFEIVKRDYVMYDSTYLCKRNDDNMSKPVYKNDVEKLKEKMAKLKHAFKCVQEMKYDEAIANYHDYPTAHIAKIETIRKDIFNNDKVVEVVEAMIKSCPTSGEIYTAAVDLLMRAEKFDLATKYAEKALQLKPENPGNYAQLVNIMREIALRARQAGDRKAELHHWYQATQIARHLQKVSTQHYGQALDLIYQFNAQLP